MKPKSTRTDTPEKLIEVATELFAANGYRGTSIRDIAKLMDMTISNIYYYYGNKSGLLLAILERSSKQLIKNLKEEIEKETDPLERFKRLLTTHLGLVEAYKKESKIFFLDEDYLDAEGNKINKDFQLEILNLYRKELHGLKQAGYLHHDNQTILSFNILGVINWHLRWYRSNGPMTLEEINKQVVNFILYGVIGNPKETDIKDD